MSSQRCLRGRILCLTTLLVAAPQGVARAQSLFDADTLPKGTGAVIINPGFGYGPGALQRFGTGWQFTRESLVADFDGIDLTEVLAGNQQGADAISLAIGKLGVTQFKAKQRAFAINFAAAYGVTDRLTIAALVPFQSVSYTLDAALLPYVPTGPEDPFAPSHYRIVNPEQLVCPGGTLADPAELLDPDRGFIERQEDSYVFNISDLNRALVSDCLGYREVVDRVETRDGVRHGIGDRSFSGFRDLALAAKYQLFHGRNLNLGLMAYVILPTGKVDNPDDLFDFKFGDGNAGGALLASITVPMGRFRFGGSVGYEVELADEEPLRLNGLGFPAELEDQLARGEISEKELYDRHLDEGQLVPIVTRFDKATVKRKLGDNVYIYSILSYQLFDWLSVGATMNFLHHFRDRIDEIGPRPEGAPRYKTEAEIRRDVAELEFDNENDRLDELKARLAESDGRKKAAYGWRTTRGQWDVGLNIAFNTVRWFLQGDFPIPLVATFGINRFLAGQNIDTPEAISFSFVIPFVTTLDIKDPNEYGFDDEEGGGLPWP